MPMFISNTKLQYKLKSFFHCTLPLINIKSYFSRNELIKWLFCWLLYPTWKNLVNRKAWCWWMGLLQFINEMSSKVGFLLVSVTIIWWPWVCICMRITSLCLKVEWKQVCEQSLYVGKIEYYYVNTKNNSKVDYSHNNNWCTVGYGNLIIGILQPLVIW